MGLAHFNLANVYAQALMLDEAIASYDRAIALEPDNAGYRWNRALKLLLKGDYERGWKEYEWRWQGCLELIGRKPRFPQSQWSGEEIRGRTLMIYREQGLGDVIQFVSYAPLLAARGAKVLLVCQPELVRLLSGAKGLAGVFSDQDALPSFDLHCPLLSLPLLLGTTLETIPASVPYIRPDPALVEAWLRRMQGPSTLRVGLIWGGWAGNTIDRKRSVPLSDFKPLSQIKGAQFFSLQKGEHAEQAKSPPPGLSLTDWTADIHDFADTAALVANLDLVISVDTAGAHLAGTMAKPVWLLNRYESEWHWLVDRGYPLM